MSDDDKTNLVLLATSIGQIGVVKQLILEGHDVNELSAEGNCALVEAARRNDTAIVKLLLKFGANPHAHDIMGNTALSWSQKHQNVEMEQFISETIAQNSAIKNSSK